MNAFLEHQRISEALAVIPSDIGYEDWWRVGAALKSELGEAGFTLFDDWSSQAPSYREAEVRTKWRSLDKITDIHIGTLIEFAKRYGYEPAAGAQMSDPVLAAQRIAAHLDRAEAARRESEARSARAAERAKAIWDSAVLVDASHAYLQKKGVKPHGLRGYEGDLAINGMSCDGAIVVPLYNSDGRLTSLEFVSPGGEKRFLPAGVKSGSYHVIGAAGKVIVIAEGYATAASAFEATGYCTFVAFDAGNLRAVAQAVRAMHSDVNIVLAADNDAKPDGSNPGVKAATEAARACNGVVAVPPRGMDLNDLHVRDGLDAVKGLIDESLPATWPTLEERPCWRVYSEWQVVDGLKRKPGVWHHNFKQRDEQEPVQVDEWICSPLFVDATTSDREDDKYGFLLRYVSRRGVWKKWAMPAEMLASDGADALGVLLAGGVEISQHKKREVLRYIASQHPKRHMRAATTTGWNYGAFVLPDEVIGDDDVWFQAAGRTAPYGKAGTLEGWKQGVAAVAIGNPMVMLAIASAFAGVLLSPLCMDGAGLHIYGDSSTGKTTALVAGISVWGGHSFRRQWRATANGLEGAGAMHTDTLLALDEIGECAPRDLYEAAYALANGTGKSRANKHGEARSAAQWRVFVLSTGETTIAARISSGGIESKAGQGLRILDLPVSGQYGLFDSLCGMDSGARLSDSLRDAATKNYGHAGRRFAASVAEAREKGIDLSTRLVEVLGQFDAPDGQERRAARVLAVASLAGELATEFGITGWASGESIRAGVQAFRQWQAQRGAPGHSAEHVGILQAVSDFIDRCGDARFSDISALAVTQLPIRDRAGYWKAEAGRRLYLFTAAGMKEAIKGYDLNRSLAALDAAGAIARKANGKNSVPLATPDGRRTRLYVIDPAKLEVCA
ncbi:DUF927 domain-containing protein [Pseudoduganella eburnea]|uniref:DUF927 domain-containing protein n=1 Tax=Massilia eburnea TaxID=1776165 RepID=A0A6L6QFT9_9BURK|nr:DUF927 domain-containing protein [Massilia eburnea]MTW10747.1 DUF927 domain-containing protein [Massilia eburnea]